MELTLGLICIPVLVVALFLAKTFHIKAFGIDFSYTKDNKLNRIHELVHLAIDHTKNIQSLNDQIFKNQMLCVDGILLKIANRLKLEIPLDKVDLVQHMIHDTIREYHRNNGFAGLNSSEFANYVASRTEELRNIYQTHVGLSKYIDSHDFSSIILEMFTHSSNCALFWTTKINDAIIKYQQDYDQIIKDL